MRAKLVAIFLVCSLVSSGCWDQKPYERIGFILQLGLELDQEDKLLYTVSIPVVGPDIQGKVKVLTTSKPLLREAREQVRMVAGKAIEAGKTQHVYFSRELARKGISPLLEIFWRQTENPLLANVIVVEGSPKQMMELSAAFKDKPRPASYVNELLVNTRQNSYIPETRIYDFTILEYSQTIDPITPLLRYNNEEIEVAGSALFDGDRMVGKINTAETGLLHALMGKKRRVQYMYHEKGEQEDSKIKEGAAVLIKGIKRKISINTEGKAPKVGIKLDLKAELDEYSEAHNMDNPKEKKKLEEAIANAIKQDCREVLEKLQNAGSDPLGIEEMVRVKHNEYWQTVTWKDVYKEVAFEVEVNMVFEFYGAIN